MKGSTAYVRLFDGYIKNNRLPLVICTIFLILGICAGSVYCTSLSNAGTLLQSIGDFGVLKENTLSREVFVASIANSFQFAMLLWLCGLSRLGVVMAPFLLAAKGFACAFCISSLVSIYGGAGLVSAAAAILPQMLVMFIIAEILCVAAINQAMYGAKSTDKAEKRRRFVSYCIFCMILFCGFVMCSLFESYVAPSLMILILGL